MVAGDLIYGGNLNFWPRSEVRFLSKACIAESGQRVLEFYWSERDVTSLPASFKFRDLVGPCGVLFLAVHFPWGVCEFSAHAQV